MDSSLTSTGLANTAPTIAGYSVSTAYQTAAGISLGKLVAKAADADGDGLSVTAAGPASAEGGTAVLQSGSILYTPQLTMLSGGHVGIDFQGIPGRQYQIQRSTNLTGWTTIGTVTAEANGAVVFTDEDPPEPSGFYRLRR